MMTEETDINNPMMNHVVLTRFFELCPLADVLKHRLISKTWYSASLARIRNDVVVNITADADKKLNWSSFDKKFKVEDVPFRCFRVYRMEFGTAPSPSTSEEDWVPSIKDLSQKTNTSIEEIRKNMDQFCEGHGRFIRKLELAHCAVFSVAAFNKVIFEAMQNLEELELNTVTNEVKVNEEREESKEMGRVNLNLKNLTVRYDVNAFNPQWKHLFVHFPNLEKLIFIEDDEDSHADFLSEVVEACEYVEEVPLKELHLVLYLNTTQQARTLKELLSLRKMKLVRLTLIMEDEYEHYDGCEEEKMSIFQVALRKQGATLRSLNLMPNGLQNRSSEGKQTYDHSEPTNNFPFRPGALEQLAILRLTGPVCTTFHFLRQTPNLIELIMDATAGEDFKICLESVKNAMLPHLKVLHIRQICIPEQELEIVAKIMPNVERFRGVLDPSALRVVFQNWEKLKFLRISMPPLDDIDDETVTGIREGCAERLPNITALKDLRCLIIENGKKKQLGESSVWNGFLKLPRLSFLQVELSSKTSREAMEALQGKITDPEGRKFTLRKSVELLVPRTTRNRRNSV